MQSNLNKGDMRLARSKNKLNKHTDHFDVETSGRSDGKPRCKCDDLSKMIVRKWFMVMRILDCFIMQI
jgi:hypothetical protein